MKHPLGKSVLISIFILGLLTAGQAQGDTDLAVIPTPSGILRLVDREQDRALFVNKGEIFKGTEFLEIVEVFKLKRYKSVLLKDMTGPIFCPVQFFFLSFEYNGDGIPERSPSFGHCNDQPNIVVKNKKVIVEFEAFGSMKPKGYIFDGRELHEKDDPS